MLKECPQSDDIFAFCGIDEQGGTPYSKIGFFVFDRRNEVCRKIIGLDLKVNAGIVVVAKLFGHVVACKLELVLPH